MTSTKAILNPDVTAAVKPDPYHLADDKCISCGQPLEEKYCANCGEKKLNRHDFAIKHYLEESFEGITHFDNKFIRTLKLLVTKPGMLSLYFSNGKRIAYMKPFQLFIVCNLLFFLLAGAYNSFSLGLYNFYSYKPFTSFGTKELIDNLANTPQKLELFSMLFNNKMGLESKSFIVFFIPVIALYCSLMFFNKKKFFSEHLVFATHYFSFVLVYYTVYSVLILKPFYFLTHQTYSNDFDTVASLLTLIILVVYFYLAVKRFYKTSVVQTLSASALMVFLFLFTLTLYRMLLFYKIIYSIHL